MLIMCTYVLQYPAPALQYFSLISLQHYSPATSQVTVFFSHTIPASSSSLSNAVKEATGVQRNERVETTDDVE